MPDQLYAYERAAIAKAFAMHYCRGPFLVPEPVQVEDDVPQNDGYQAFNLNFSFRFSDKPLVKKGFHSHLCDVLPNNYGPTLAITVDNESLALLRVESLNLEAADPRSYMPYILAVQPWLQGCLLTHGSQDADGIAVASADALRLCLSDFSRFALLRLMIIDDLMCFFGQIGARAIVRGLREIRRISEPERQLSIRTNNADVLAIDGFAPVPLTQSSGKVFWIRDDKSS